jgi:hypothetical protein
MTRTAPEAAMTSRALGRATLARQMLLARDRRPALGAIERLAALQAQMPRTPFVALWSRLKGFRRERLARLLGDHSVVRATTMRGTLHLLSARDYAAMRAALQPSLTRGMQAILRDRMKGLDVDAVTTEARRFFGDAPRTFTEVRDFLIERFPKGDERAMGYAVRLHLPLVQVPTDDPWSFPATAKFALAEPWLGAPLPAGEGPEAIVLRYLAALGPATAADVQSWTGLADARVVVEGLRPKLRSIRGERGGELFDLPDAPRPPEETPAPARLLPEFDNVLLGHANRKRFVADEHRSRIYLPGLRVAATFLVDGRVAGTWTLARAKNTASLVLEPFAAIPKAASIELHEEAAALLRFVEPDAASFDVRVAQTGGRKAGAAGRIRAS